MLMSLFKRFLRHWTEQSQLFRRLLLPLSKTTNCYLLLRIMQTREPVFSSIF